MVALYVATLDYSDAALDVFSTLLPGLLQHQFTLSNIIGHFYYCSISSLFYLEAIPSRFNYLSRLFAFGSGSNAAPWHRTTLKDGLFTFVQQRDTPIPIF